MSFARQCFNRAPDHNECGQSPVFPGQEEAQQSLHLGQIIMSVDNLFLRCRPMSFHLRWLVDKILRRTTTHGHDHVSCGNNMWSTVENDQVKIPMTSEEDHDHG